MEVVNALSYAYPYLVWCVLSTLSFTLTGIWGAHVFKITYPLARDLDEVPYSPSMTTHGRSHSSVFAPYENFQEVHVTLAPRLE